MIEPNQFIDTLAYHSYDIVSGVPCSNISALFHILESTKRLRYIPATTEGEAVGIAAGSWLTGKKAAVICQNSGVGNMVNPLASLNAPYGIPTTLFVSMRGAVGFPDEPQHDIMGRESGKLLELLSVKTGMLPDNFEEFDRALAQAGNELFNLRSSAFLINPKIINNSQVIQTAQVTGHNRNPVSVYQPDEGALVNRRNAIEILMQGGFEKYSTIATTGHAYRELYATGDRPNYFYMTGSMGHAASIGLGVAINTSFPVVILDGDGAFLMKMGTGATIGRQAPRNLVHVVLDNGQFESTGGQSTNAGSADLAQVASALGYRQVWRCAGREAIEHFRRTVDPTNGPTFAHIVVSSSSDAVAPRPKINLHELAVRFRSFAIHLPK